MHKREGNIDRGEKSDLQKEGKGQKLGEAVLVQPARQCQAAVIGCAWSLHEPSAILPLGLTAFSNVAHQG